MTEAWRKFRALDDRQRRMLAQAFVLLPLTALGIRCLGLRRWQALLAGITPLPLSDGDRNQAALIAAADYLVAVAAYRGLHRANCLQRSLVVWWLLRRAGVATELRIGVRKEAARLEAHAWVECAGYVINDRADVGTRFTAFEGPIHAQEGPIR